MVKLRPVDLARAHGLSTQAVRDCERDGILPPARRTSSGYRVYAPIHAAALTAYRALVPAFGRAAAVRIMLAVNADDLAAALPVIDDGHGLLARDRATLDAVASAVGELATTPNGSRDARVRTVGELARRIGLSPATLREWETSGILSPARDPATGYRLYDADDTRDAELAHLLRRGGHPLDRVAVVVREVRTAGGTGELTAALDDRRRALTARGVAMLDAAARLSEYLGARRAAADGRSERGGAGGVDADGGSES